jgi:hypothetical protein
MLVNFSNHPSGKWSDEQKKSAISLFGSILDYPFPEIDPEASSSTVQELARQYFLEITQEFKADIVIHVMGESTFCFHFVTLCKTNGIDAYASTTKRIVSIDNQGVKTSQFCFFKFRKF